MKKPLLIVLIISALGLVTVSARVFRVLQAPPGRLNAAGLGWEHAYTTSMNVNGVQNEVVVFAADPRFPVLEQLKGQFEDQGAEIVLKEGAGGVRGQVTTGGELTANVLVVDAGEGMPRHMVFLFYPEQGGSAGRPEMPVPEFPNGVAEQLVTNDKTGSICRIIKTEADPSQVMGFYATALSADGWSTVLPSGANDSRMTLFQKGDRTCSVMAVRSPDGLNRVTVLVNGGAF